MTTPKELLRALFGPGGIAADLKPSFSSYGDLKLPLELVHPKATVDMLGYLPCWLDPADPRGAVDQLDANYQTGGGWRELTGWTLHPDRMSYPGDPDRPLLAKMKLRDETVLFFHGGYTAVVQPDGSASLARMD